MKVILLFLIYLTLNTYINAQSFSVDLEKARKINLLELERQDVKEILLDENSKYIKKDYSHQLSDTFYTNFATIEVYYSTGNCSNEDEDWNIEKEKVTAINITPKDYLNISGSRINFKSFKKERRWGKNTKEKFIYHSKEKGIAIYVSSKLIDNIAFIPPRKSYENLCDKREVKEYYFGKKWNRYPIMKKNYIEYNSQPEVTDIKLNRNEIISDCQSIKLEKRKMCLDNNKVSVITSATDRENDVLQYSYEVTGGKIIGQGSKVTWDLSKVEPGSYKITAYTDDGCGYYCGKWMTKTIAVK